MAERHLVVGVELDRAAEGVAGLVHAALGRERLAQVVPGVGVLGSQLGRAPQLLGGVVGVELDAGAPGEHQQLDVLWRGGETCERRLTALRGIRRPGGGARVRVALRTPPHLTAGSRRLEADVRPCA